MVTTVFNWVYKFLILGLGHCPDFDHFPYVTREKVLVHVQFIMTMVSGGREGKGLRGFEQSQGLLLYCLFKAGALNVWTTRMKNKYKTVRTSSPNVIYVRKHTRTPSPSLHVRIFRNFVVGIGELCSLLCYASIAGKTLLSCLILY